MLLFFLPSSWPFAFYDIGLKSCTVLILSTSRLKSDRKRTFPLLKEGLVLCLFRHTPWFYTPERRLFWRFSTVFSSVPQMYKLITMKPFCPSIIHNPFAPMLALHWMTKDKQLRSSVSGWFQMTHCWHNVNTLLDNIYYVDNVDRLLTHLDTLLIHF